LFLIKHFVTGILQADTGVIRDNKQMFRLFCHESMRVFHDRLINKEDKGFFYTILAEMAGKHFSEVSILYISSLHYLPEF
jgi:dynein heavy chain